MHICSQNSGELGAAVGERCIGDKACRVSHMTDSWARAVHKGWKWGRPPPLKHLEELGAADVGLCQKMRYEFRSEYVKIQSVLKPAAKQRDGLSRCFECDRDNDSARLPMCQ
eukprot:SAG11_NODE_2381_length_3426_cov_2.697507_4_plen_112_part_00